MPPSASHPAGTLAWFVSGHGFGHAARACAIVEALRRRAPHLGIDLYTSTPAWFFQDSLTAPIDLHACRTDVGLVQRTSLEEDPSATVDELATFLPLSRPTVARLAERLHRRRTRLVVADISPLGLEVARTAGLPAALVENFTWDWIYASYLQREPRLAAPIATLAPLYAGVDLRLQVEPCCAPVADGVAVPPVGRAARRTRAAARRALGLDAERPVVLLSMGGFPWHYGSLDPMARRRDVVFVVLGGAERPTRRDNLVLLPHRTGHYHPDLLAAADLLVGKIGYSTLAEAYLLGAPYLFVGRPSFPEAAVLARFARRHLPSRELTGDQLTSGAWVELLDGLLGVARPAPRPPLGAELAATRLLALVV